MTWAPVIPLEASVSTSCCWRESKEPNASSPSSKENRGLWTLCSGDIPLLLFLFPPELTALSVSETRVGCGTADGCERPGAGSGTNSASETGADGCEVALILARPLDERISDHSGVLGTGITRPRHIMRTSKVKNYYYHHSWFQNSHHLRQRQQLHCLVFHLQ